MIDSFPRVGLAFLPTPLHQMKNLGDSLGLNNLWIKRDDMTGIGLGGNKIRKLEFVAGDARANGADTLVTVGAVQSNHCRQTAAIAARLGMRCILLLAGEEPKVNTGNLLLDKLFGAELKFFPDDTYSSLNNKLDNIMETLQDFGLKPYAIPGGAAMPIGVIAYAAAMQELQIQLEETGFAPEKIVVGIGTGGTLAGMLLGAQMMDMDVQIVGVSVSESADELKERVSGLIHRTIEAYPEIFSKYIGEILVDDQFIGDGYGIMGEGGKTAIEMFGKMEGILLDPVYTSKAGLALMRMALAGVLEANTPTLFWHTGGHPALYAHAAEFYD
ncbi:MAG: 1-aminocyclopropane-1-carboxylate deaminase/D-cysteine desulfhydrase [Candidatus Thorarchaeota archaeon]|jgi:D-cysteine desulfhydrase family pyridoxal phosphate-dependent enzyme